MSVFFQELADLSRVQWGRQWLWDIAFGGDVNGQNRPPPPFDFWFPAFEATPNVFNLDYYQIQAGNTSVRIPIGAVPLDMQLSFYDDENNSLMHWIEDWVNGCILSMTTGGEGILAGTGNFSLATLEESVRELFLVRTDIQKGILDFRKFWVYPDQNFYDRLTSDPALKLYTANFQVAAMEKLQ